MSQEDIWISHDISKWEILTTYLKFQQDIWNLNNISESSTRILAYSNESRRHLNESWHIKVRNFDKISEILTRYLKFWQDIWGLNNISESSIRILTCSNESRRIQKRHLNESWHIRMRQIDKISESLTIYLKSQQEYLHIQMSQDAFNKDIWMSHGISKWEILSDTTNSNEIFE